jgi:hypothetical protein
LIKTFSKQKRELLKSDMEDVSFEEMKASIIDEKCQLSL